MEEQWVRLRGGTIVDATITEVPPSTRNRAGERDPEMRQVKKGNQYHFRMKVHIGADAGTGVVHSLGATSANMHHVTEATCCCTAGRNRCGETQATPEYRNGQRIGSWR